MCMYEGQQQCGWAAPIRTSAVEGRQTPVMKHKKGSGQQHVRFARRGLLAQWDKPAGEGRRQKRGDRGQEGGRGHLLAGRANAKKGKESMSTAAQRTNGSGKTGSSGGPLRHGELGGWDS